MSCCSQVAELGLNPDVAVIRHLTSPTGAEVHLIGTAHILEGSALAVEQLIRALRPDAVVVELCMNRKGILDPAFHNTPPPDLTTADYIKIIKTQGQAGLAAALLSSYLKGMATKLDITLGREFLVASETAQEVGAKVYLGDRDVRVTIARCTHALSLWAKMRCVGSMFYEAIFLSAEVLEAELKRVMGNIEQEIAEMFPSLRVPLVEERDAVLAANIRSVRASRVVAVVGAGHIEGIVRKWEEPIDVRSLVSFPPPKASSRVLRVRVLVPLGLGLWMLWRYTRR